jgi:ATP-dependent Clp protease ATP-binding subunit ClpB
MLHRTLLDPTRAGNRAEELKTKLRGLIIGQNEALDQIVDIYQMYLVGLATPGRPIGSFLFLGPTGSGKTRTVEATAEALVGNPGGVIKIDCAEFQQSHEIAKLIGSPPGYLGHRETHPMLSQEVINAHHTDTVKMSFILFDEIEKASDALWNLLLGVLDKGRLTLGDNRRVDFSQSMIFMTSNLGANEMSELVRPKLGFHAEKRGTPAGTDEELSSKMSRSGVEAARRKFAPEFMNRIDKIAVFRPLGQSELRSLLSLELAHVQRRILEMPAGKPFVFHTTDAANAFLLTEGTDMKYGARHLKRAIERRLVHPLSNLLATGQIGASDWIELDYKGEGKLTFSKIGEGFSLKKMGGLVEDGRSKYASVARAA